MSSKVKIAARLRPRLQGEVDDGGLQVIHATDGSGSYISVPNPRDVSQVFKFPFTSCYDEHAAQEEIFEKDVRPLIDVVYSGVTVTIFAYGVTSSGKTHTMQGTKELPGVIPRVVEAMFAHRASSDLTNTSLNMSYFEIHKDEVYDLLVNRADAPKLPVRENDAGQVFVANLSSEPIASTADFNTHFSRANKQRSVGSTNLNNQSSRSHAILTIEVHMPDESAGRLITGKINLVDLAGSENNKLTGNDPSRMAESAAINKSLSVLGQVVHALNTGASRIPYRNSKLTRILQDALGGQSVGLLICNLAPSMKFRQDTLNTLNFAVRTKNVENRPVVNEKDTRPAPKPHFAAVAVKPSRGPAANIPALAHGPLPPVPMPAATRAHDDEPSPLAPIPVAANGRGSVRGRRPSLLPQPIPRPPSAATINPLHRTSGGSSLIGLGISDADVDEKIKRLVEAEVNRRMEDIMERQRGERERQRALQAAREREAAQANGSTSTTISVESTAASSSNRSRTLEEASQILDQAPPYVQDEEEEPQRTETVKAEDNLIPPRAVSPILAKMDPDMDNKLVSKLEEVEREVTREAREVDIASQLSPTSRKRTGRAYVAQARAHSNKGDLAAALEFYQKAEKYVPDNVKLKERIIEIEWCIREGKPFDQAPSASDGKKAKPGKKTRSSTKTSATNSGRGTPAAEEGPTDDEEAKMDVEAPASPPRRRSKGKNKVKEEAKAETPEPTTFGADMTNGNSPGKRPRGDETPVAKVEDGGAATPERPAQKRTRTSRKKTSEVKVEVDESEEETEVVGPRRSKRAAGRVKAEA